MLSRNLLPVGALGLALLIGIGALRSHADQNEVKGAAGALAGVAVVDMARVYSASGALDQLEQMAVNFEAEAAQRVNSFAAMRYLDANQLQEYAALLRKTPLTDTDQTRIKELKQIVADREQEWQKLSAIPQANLTQENKARFRELREMKEMLEKVMPLIQENSRNAVNARIDAARRDQVTQLREVVKQVAKEKGYTNVFDATALVYSTNDLTPLVVQRVSKRPGNK